MNQTEKYEDYLLGIVLEGLKRTERFVVIRQNSVVDVFAAILKQMVV